MTIGLIFDGPGVTQEQYDQVFNQVMSNREKPPGMLSHHGGPSDSGWCVVETWESPEDIKRFFDEKLGQALGAAGINGQPRTFEITNSV